MQDLINRIKQKGYWKITVRPEEFVEKRINSREELKGVIEACKVILRGWDYPHIDRNKGIFNSGNDSIASFSDWPEEGYLEYWQLYQNGLFIHYRSMKEDYSLGADTIEGLKNSFHFTKSEEIGDKFFNSVNAIYLVTEIFVFASNLVNRVDFGDSVVIEIELGDVEGRTLYIGDPSKMGFMRAYTCLFHNENIKKELTITTTDFATQRDKLAADVVIGIFSDFNWTDINRGVIEADQKRLLERRL